MNTSSKGTAVAVQVMVGRTYVYEHSKTVLELCKHFVQIPEILFSIDIISPKFKSEHGQILFGSRAIVVLHRTVQNDVGPLRKPMKPL